MVFIIALIIAVLFTVFCGNVLRKHPVPFYVGAAVISVIVIVCTWVGVRFPTFVSNWIWPLFARGALAGSLFVIIMWAGAFPNGTKPIKKLMPVRGELSIIACILTFGHNIAYGKTYFRLLFTNPSILSWYYIAAAICSIVMIIIIIPLFITSFKPVRRKMNGRSWKKLQRFAYLFYGILYIHIMLLTIPQLLAGKTAYVVTVLVYSVIFFSYTICRVLKAKTPKSSDTALLKRRQFIGSGIAVVIAVCLTVGLAAAADWADDAVTAESAGSSEATEETAEENEESEETGEEDDSYAASEEDGDDIASDNESSDDTAEEPAETDTSADENEPASDESADTNVENTSEPSASPFASASSSSSDDDSTAASDDSAAAAVTDSVSEDTATPTPTEEPTPTPTATTVYRDGTYSGTADGYEGPITVSVTIQNDVITSVTVTSASDDEPYYSLGTGVISSIISANSASVNTVSGATYTSTGIINAVKNALASAKN